MKILLGIILCLSGLFGGTKYETNVSYFVRVGLFIVGLILIFG